MSMFIRGDELYSPHFPVVGATPSLYGFNNLPNVLGSYVNKIQMYDRWTGKLLPSFTPGSLMTDMINNFKSNPNYATYEKQRIKTSVYNNDTKKFTVGLIGTEKDIDIARKALDEYMNKP